jgi:hypothetical protein
MYEVNEETKWKLDMKVGGIEDSKIKIFHFVTGYHNHMVKNSSVFCVTVL